MMKTVFCLLLGTILMMVVTGFRPTAVGARTSAALSMTKRFPAGRPVTVQLDEDMAMWFEDKQGNKQKALKKPVGGRPATLYTKKDVEEIEKKGVSPFEQLGAKLEYWLKRPTRGY